MTVPASTVPTFTAWLLNRLTTQIAAAVGESIEVIFGPVGQNQPDDIVWLATGRRQVAPMALTGNMQAASTQERYDIDINVSVTRGNDDFLALEARLWAIVAGIETVVRTDVIAVIQAGTQQVNFGGAVIWVGVGDHAPVTDWAADNESLTEMTYPISVLAQI